MTLGTESAVVDANVTTNSKMFLQAINTEAAALTIGGLFVVVGAGSFTATHSSAVSTAGKFDYMVR